MFIWSKGSCEYGDSSAQIHDEIKRLAKNEGQQLLHTTELPVVILADQGLATKADLSLSSNTLCMIRR